MRKQLIIEANLINFYVSKFLFAIEHKYMTLDQWKKVMWFEDSRLTLFPSDGGIREIAEVMLPSCLVPAVQVNHTSSYSLIWSWQQQCSGYMFLLLIGQEHESVLFWFAIVIVVVKCLSTVIEANYTRSWWKITTLNRNKCCDLTDACGNDATLNVFRNQS